MHPKPRTRKLLYNGCDIKNLMYEVAIAFRRTGEQSCITHYTLIKLCSPGTAKRVNETVCLVTRWVSSDAPVKCTKASKNPISLSSPRFDFAQVFRLCDRGPL